MSRSWQNHLGLVIVTYNSLNALSRFLKCIDASMLENLVVVDNASKDGTQELLATIPHIRVITNDCNRGYALAANQGAQELTTPVICFINPDCEPEQRLFSMAVARLEEDADDCVVPEALTDDNRSIPAKRFGYTRTRLLVEILVSNYPCPSSAWRMLEWPLCNDYRWRWPHGACLFISRSRFLALSGFDTAYPMYMVDVAFGQRLHEQGGRIITVPACLVHREGNGSRISSLSRLEMLNSGRIRFAKNQYGVLFSSFLSVLAWPGFMLRKIVDRRP